MRQTIFCLIRSSKILTEFTGGDRECLILLGLGNCPDTPQSTQPGSLSEAIWRMLSQDNRLWSGYMEVKSGQTTSACLKLTG